MSIFHHQTIHFSAQDPLGDGLGDDIAKEQREPEAIKSLEDIPSGDLEQFWGQVIEDAKKDKDFFAFADD
jgi:hypothetical protein